MRQRLADGESALVGVEFARKHDGNDVGGAGRPRANRERLGQPGVMVVAQLRHPLTRAAEQAAMRGQHQHIRRQALVQGQGIQKPLERVGLRFVRPHAHIGGNARQQHVA